jgi:hypothetical protein
LGNGRIFLVWLKYLASLAKISIKETDDYCRPSETTSLDGVNLMSLNKHDLDSYRRAKRHRARKIDLLIIVLFLLVAIVLTLDHPAPGRGAPAFHKAQTKTPVPAEATQPVIARAVN